ncbi:type II methionyl aminopeptidase [Candidatus Pacearchaeota archaeon]|nr:type II methionyl aminopeptidase [Candidatus Pacearchaeota archaeon]|tara:strand:+ start:4921 stop:5826 length:906 start_codon:yes stop_codon:yes gene_type:complete
METNETESYLKAGEIAKEVKTFMKELVKKGMLLIDIAEGIEGKIRELGAEPAFPVNTSIDEIAAHYTPLPGDEKVASGLLKIDVGICVDGFIADFAVSFDFSDDESHGKMFALNKGLLETAKKVVHPDMKVSEIGNSLGEFLEKFNIENDTRYSVVENLCGHTLGENKIHGGITIPNSKNDSNVELEEKAFAVEPFVTEGEGNVREGEGGGIYALSGEGAARDRDVREILTFIKESYKTRPFCARWLEKEGFKKIKFALSSLTRQGVLRHYPLLIGKSNMPISQFEDSFLIDEDRVLCFTC